MRMKYLLRTNGAWGAVDREKYLSSLAAAIVNISGDSSTDPTGRGKLTDPTGRGKLMPHALLSLLQLLCRRLDFEMGKKASRPRKMCGEAIARFH
ncbi:hypothetical protein E2562_024549 [Oryza meyeriana var. granulata]|uniref:Uncharacterized protein n=1 Tax=Oryza meyeriana var. granulata TaxID=110450 RepID=A0A6G1BNZ5_9ORYZ|nr:hypothetical protein E2562_024549 [Oryza meyeriana var. granulata]